MRSSRRRHKPAAIRQILARFPDMVFLLLDDSGERDPEIYLETVQRYPGRILATYIRQVNLTAKRMAQIDTLVQAAAAAGSEFILVEDSLAIARHAAARGWIQPAAVATIAAAQAGIVPGKHSTGSAHS